MEYVKYNIYSEICSKLIIKAWRQWRRSGVFIVNFEHSPQYLVPYKQ